jgi:hypothetical protein
MGPVPAKWKEGGQTGLKVVTTLLRSETLPAAVYHVSGISADAWQRYWDESTSFAAKLRDVTDASTAFAGPVASNRLNLFARAFARNFQQVLKLRGWKNPAPPDHPDSVEISAIFDADIQDREAQRVLETTLRDWPKNSRFGRMANLQMALAGTFRTEQEEPLILLADYLAGLFHHAHPAVRLGKPVIPVDEARRLAAQLKQDLGQRLVEDDESFDTAYPLFFEEEFLGGLEPRQ